MQRLLIAAASAALLVATAVPAMADDYPACTHKDQDKCRVVVGGMHDHHHHAAPHHHMPPKHHKK